MGWRGAGGNGAASTGKCAYPHCLSHGKLPVLTIDTHLLSPTGVYFMFGSLLMILGSIGEWIVGNTFPFVVFGTFGAFWGAFGCTLVPWFNAYGAYVVDPKEAATMMGNPGNPLGLQSPAFNASFAFFLLFMGESFSLFFFFSDSLYTLTCILSLDLS